MTADIVAFPKPSQHIWVCNCGCSTFNLCEDGSAVCANCDATAGCGTWYDTKPDGPETTEPPFADVQGNGSVDFSRARIRRMAADDDVAMIVFAKADGAVSAWFDAKTEEQRRWFRERLDDAMDLLNGFHL